VPGLHVLFFFFQAEDGIRDFHVTGVQTCALPIYEYLGYSAGLDFESKIVVKRNAPWLLEAALARPGYRVGKISMSGVTDCYQPRSGERRVGEESNTGGERGREKRKEKGRTREHMS